MGKKYLYVAGDSFSVIGGNSIEVPHDEESIQHRRHLNDKESLKSWELTEESEKTKNYIKMHYKKNEIHNGM